jgi:signal transduction histidine kinase
MTSTQLPQGPSRRAVLPIRLKLAAALLVPLAAVASLCWVQVSQSRDRVKDVETETNLARTSLAPGGLVDALIVEQADATVSLLAIRETTTLPTRNWKESYTATDKALASLRKGIEAGGPAAKAAFGDTLDGIEKDLADRRASYDKMIDSAGLANIVVVLDELYPKYSAIITKLIDANDTLAAAISDPEMRAAAVTLNDVNLVHFNVSRVMSAVGTGILRPGNEGRDPVMAGETLYEQSIIRLRSRTDGPWAPAVKAFAANENYQKIIDEGYSYLRTGKIDLQKYIGLNPPVDNRKQAPMGTTQRVAQSANQELAKRIDAKLSDARDEQTRYTYLAIGVMLAATAAAAIVARSVVRPMRKLTEQAEAMAAHHLPNAVKSVLDTPTGEDVVVPHLDPVSVRSHDELQTVAAAINHVQASALDLAVEQATLRRNIADSYVSMGRRTQNLIGLQLELISELENDEADPAVLDSLYRLDHLATRARRNAESLVVLAGTETPRHGAPPAPMTDILRATLSEVESYQRVDVAYADQAVVPGALAPDLIHLLAELVENGLAFSPPDSRVRVEGLRTDEGYTLRVIDQGVGMTPGRIEEANRRLAGRETFTVAPSRYLGHYVTGKLAERVGATVTLRPGDPGGIIAEVALGASSLLADDTPVPVSAEDSEAAELIAAAEKGADEGTGNEAEIAHDAPDGFAPVGVNGNGHGPVESGDLDDPNIRVDGRPPMVTAPDADEELEEATLANGLRKRVPGKSSAAVRDRSPLLRTGAAAAGSVRSEALNDEDQAQNLASLLTSYTSGLERGREDAERGTDDQ